MVPPAGRSAAVAQRILERIANGYYPSGSQLPVEPDLCAEMDVSRGTLREAVKSLQQRGVVSVEQGRGTFVTSPDQWSPFDPVLLLARTAGVDGPNRAWAEKLVEVRQLVEVGVAALAAERRDDADLAAMQVEITAMANAREAHDAASFAAADLAFHDALMAAARNDMLAALFDPISQLIQQGRLATSQTAERHQSALKAHAAIYRAVAAGDPPAAARAMRAHLDDTLRFIFSGQFAADAEGAEGAEATSGAGA